jgi:cytoskeletal protein RodZ
MTNSRPATRPTRRSLGNRGNGSSGPNGRSGVGEKLRDAREVRGVDLFRVERDTKIRTKYLAALEDGDFTDLPGDVYARGFLRNYSTYLGLDPDEMEEEWREEAGQAAPIRPVITGPQPLTMRRKVIFQQSHAVLALVLIVILVVAGYFGFQLTRYLSYPTVSVASAGASPIVVGVGQTSYTLTGTATPNTTVLISYNGQEPIEVVADDSGHWTYHAILGEGPNQFDITAKNLDTNHASKTVRIVVVLPTLAPTPEVPSVAFLTPADGTALTAGNIAITGTSDLVTSVTLTSTKVGAPLLAGQTIPPAPLPGVTTPPGLAFTTATTSTAADGSFTFAAPLQPGLWQLSLVGTTTSGTKTAAVVKTISIPYKGVNVNIKVSGGVAAVTVFVDGVATSRAVGRPDGWSTTVVGNRSVCIRSSKLYLVYITANGTSYGKASSVIGNGLDHIMIDSKGLRAVATCG